MCVLTCSCAFAGKMYACQYCDAVFAQSIELSRHVRTHTGDKPYVCRDCGKGFRQANGLSIHLHTFHSTYCSSHVRYLRPHLALRRPLPVIADITALELVPFGALSLQSCKSHSPLVPYKESLLRISLCFLLLCPDSPLVSLAHLTVFGWQKQIMLEGENVFTVMLTGHWDN